MNYRTLIVSNIRDFAKELKGETLTDVEKNVGLSENRLTYVLETGAKLDIDDIMAVANYLELTLADLMDQDSRAKLARIKIANLERQLQEARAEAEQLDAQLSSTQKQMQSETNYYTEFLEDREAQKVFVEFVYRKVATCGLPVTFSKYEQVGEFLSILRHAGIHYKDGSILGDAKLEEFKIKKQNAVVFTLGLVKTVLFCRVLQETPVLKYEDLIQQFSAEYFLK